MTKLPLSSGPTKTHRSASTRIPPFKALLAFESVARTKSVTRSSIELGLTPSAVSHQIAHLEALVGGPLFSRCGQGLILNPAGERYLGEVTGLLAQLSYATEQASKNAGTQELRVHSSPSFGLLWLLPRLKAFQHYHENIEFRLACSYEDVSFAGGYYDIDIRHGLANWTGLEVYSLLGECIMPMASAAYLKEFPVHVPADLLQRRLIYSQTPLVQWPQWFSRHGIPHADKKYDFYFDRSYMSIEVAAQGLGIALESSLLAVEHLKRGALLPVFGSEYRIEVSAHHIVFPPRSKFLTRVKCFLDWLGEEAPGLLPIPSAA